MSEEQWVLVYEFVWDMRLVDPLEFSWDVQLVAQKVALGAKSAGPRARSRAGSMAGSMADPLVEALVQE